MNAEFAQTLQDLSGGSVTLRSGGSEPRFKKLTSLRAYAAAGKGPQVDTPAWDPDEDAAPNLNDRLG